VRRFSFFFSPTAVPTFFILRGVFLDLSYLDPKQIPPTPPPRAPFLVYLSVCRSRARCRFYGILTSFAVSVLPFFLCDLRATLLPDVRAHRHVTPCFSPLRSCVRGDRRREFVFSTPPPPSHNFPRGYPCFFDLQIAYPTLHQVGGAWVSIV